MGSKVASTITRNFWWKLIQLTQVNFFCFLFNKIFNTMFCSSWICVFICRSGKKDGAIAQYPKNYSCNPFNTRLIDAKCLQHTAQKPLISLWNDPSRWASVTWLRLELLESAMATTKIRKTPGICNGAACIGRTQIPVWQLVSLQLQGCSDATLLGDYPQLTRDDLKAVRTYYTQNPEEIDEAIAAENSEN